MRALVFPVIVLFLTGVALGGWQVIRYLRGREQSHLRWEEHHQLGPGQTQRNVYVRKGTELELIGSVSTTDPDYSDKFFRLMDHARLHASVLNSES